MGDGEGRKNSPARNTFIMFINGFWSFQFMVVYAVIPAHNEQTTIRGTIAGIQRYVNHIIVVDDGSVDRTSEAIKDTGAIVLRHRVNLGKGAALKTGCDYALMKGAEKIVVLDADGQHEPAEIPAFLQALNNADIVFGSRQRSISMPLVLKFGNWFINKTLQRLSAISVQDSQCGYRAFTVEAYRKIRWHASDYYMETEMIINAGKHALRSAHVPIRTIYADKYKGTTVLDGIKIVLKILGGRIAR